MDAYLYRSMIFALAILVGQAHLLSQELYFPLSDNKWERVTPESLGWDNAKLEEVCQFVADTHGKSFLILQDGKIAVERYWTPAGAAHAQYVMSSGKSITAFVVGIAKEQNKLDIEQPVSDFLGTGWSKASAIQEKAIRIEHLLHMTSGLNSKLEFAAPPGTIWRYNTEVYQQLHPLLEKAVGKTMQEFSSKVLFEPVGMTNSRFRFHSFVMNARDMGRFGLIVLGNGKWHDQPIMQDRKFFDSMLESSQNLNRSYGYLWWLNGKESYRTVGKQRGEIQGPLVPSAPADMVSANGKGGQRIYIAASLGLVVVRLGDTPTTGHPGPRKFQSDGTQSNFDEQLWSKLMLAIEPPSK
jgi:CubicO group peptidase (beta-lactamase class C family)